MNVNVMKRLYWRACNHGVWRAARITAVDAWDAYLEWRLGLETAREVATEELGFGPPEYRPYSPCSYWEFTRAMKVVRPTPDDVFLDIGSGKGRALILAATYPMRRVLGIELSETLNALARDNIAKCRKRLRCQSVEVIHADATQFAIPGDVTIIYMYNSVTGALLAQVLDQIHASLSRKPRSVRILYHNVTEVSKTLDQSPWMTRVCEVPSVRGRGRDYVLFHAQPRTP